MLGNGKGFKMSRITERRIYAIPSTLFISDGTNKGQLQVTDNSLWMVGQIVVLTSDTQDNLELKIKRILPDKNTMFVGPKDKNIHVRTDISDFLITDNAALQSNEQERPSVPEQEVERATFEEEPTVARRVIIVDKWGCRIDEANPLPVSATISVSSVGTPQIFNVSAPDKSTEYSQALPTNTAQFQLRARNSKAKLHISYVLNATSTNYFTVMPGNIFKIEAVKLTGKTLYIKSSLDNTTVEVMTWV